MGEGVVMEGASLSLGGMSWLAGGIPGGLKLPSLGLLEGSRGCLDATWSDGIEVPGKVPILSQGGIQICAEKATIAPLWNDIIHFLRFKLFNNLCFFTSSDCMRPPDLKLAIHPLNVRIVRVNYRPLLCPGMVQKLTNRLNDLL